MLPNTITLPPLRLRPIAEPPEGDAPVTALIFQTDETPGEDNIGAYLTDELYAWDGDRWGGKLTGRALPRNARWWLPELDLTRYPTIHARRDAAIHAPHGDTVHEANGHMDIIWEDA